MEDIVRIDPRVQKKVYEKHNILSEEITLILAEGNPIFKKVGGNQIMAIGLYNRYLTIFFRYNPKRKQATITTAMREELNLGKLEDVKVTFGKHAFVPKVMYCDKCDIKMKKMNIDVFVSAEVKIRLNAFRCHKCREEMIGLDEAKKLDIALIINRLLSNDYSLGFKRKLNYDGANYIFRLPTELARGKHTEVTILPIESNEALIKW